MTIHIAHYKMNDNTTNHVIADSSGNALDGVSITHTDTMSVDGKINAALEFDGAVDYGRVADNNLLDFGTGVFTISAWINVGTIGAEIDQLGNILTKFDQTNKKGFNLGFLRQSGGGQSNNRNLFFGIDNNKPNIIWAQVAPKLAGEEYIVSLAVFNGKSVV